MKGLFKSKLVLSLVTLVLLAGAIIALSGPITHSLAAANDVTYSFGPIHSSSTDSGTCGINDWANDTFDRLFIVHSSTPNTFTENFQNGTFVTIASQSPGACQILSSPNGNQNTVGAGVTGTFFGAFGVVTVTGGRFNPRATCNQTTCSTTTAFCTTVYGSLAKCNVNSFKFNYYTNENGSWQNASADVGGNRGDITGPASNPPADSNSHHISKPSVN